VVVVVEEEEEVNANAQLRNLDVEVIQRLDDVAAVTGSVRRRLRRVTVWKRAPEGGARPASDR
jgi:hypothetical protein